MKMCALTVVLLFVAAPSSAGILGGEVKYTPPDTNLSAEAFSRLVPETPDAVWKAAVAYAAESSFGIENVDKDSYLLVLSFSFADPESYVDCGRTTSWVKNLRGRRDYSFPPSRAYVEYEVLDKGNLLTIKRKVTLEGKVNVIVSESGDGTRLKVNARYAIKWNGAAHWPLNYYPPQNFQFAATFNSGASGANEGGTTCQSTQKLERTILDGIERILVAKRPASPEEVALQSVQAGMSAAQVRELVARDADGFEAITVADGVRRIWTYHFPKGNVQVVFLNDTVTEVRRR